MLTGFAVGGAIVVAAAILWLVAKSIGPTVQDGLVQIGAWTVTMVALATPAGVAVRAAFAADLSETTKSAMFVIALFAFLLASLVAWRGFREQRAAVQKLLPEPPKTSSKRRLDRAL